MTTTVPSPSQPPSSRVRLMNGHLILAGLCGLLVALVVLPDVVRLDRSTPFTQLVAFRPVTATCTAAAAMVFGLLAIRFRRLWPYPAALAVVVCIATSLVLPRVAGSPAQVSNRQLTVLSFNSYYGLADAAALADLIAAERPDLVALPEAGPRFRARLAGLVGPLGYRTFGADDGGRSEVGGMTVLVANHLGDVTMRAGTEATFPYLEVTGGGLGELRFVAMHPVPPAPGNVALWRDELGSLRRWCGTGKPAIIAGDLNATLDHSVLRAAMQGCTDAADQNGAGLIGTWPSSKPRWLGPQIDHILATDGIDAQDFAVYDIPGSDHRAVLARFHV